MPDRTEAWMAVVQDEDGTEETEVVTFTPGAADGLIFCAGTIIELTNGQRITLIEPAGEQAA